MKKNVFYKSIPFLIVTLLLLAVLVPKVMSQKLMVAAVILWLLFLLGYYLYRGFQLRASSLDSRKTRRRKASQAQRQRTESPQVFPTEIPSIKPSFPGSVQKGQHMDGSQEIMLQHIALRITDKLKSAYPEATWKWKDTPSLEDILSGGTHRIIVDDMEQYTHADISFDKFARIHIEPLILGSFKTETAPNSPTVDDEPAKKEPAVIDVKVWYEMVGQKILQTQITELNCKGHSKLTVKENGDIVIKKLGKDLLLTSLDAFPARNYWQELITLLESDELNGKISGDTLQISWI